MAGLHVVEGNDPELMHEQMAQAVEDSIVQIRSIQQQARKSGKPNVHAGR